MAKPTKLLVYKFPYSKRNTLHILSPGSIPRKKNHSHSLGLTRGKDIAGLDNIYY